MFALYQSLLGHFFLFFHLACFVSCIDVGPSLVISSCLHCIAVVRCEYMEGANVQCKKGALVKNRGQGCEKRGFCRVWRGCLL